MTREKLQEFQEQKEKIDQLAALLKELFDDAELRRWSQVDIEKNQALLLGVFGGKPLAAEGDQESLAVLINAQIIFRLHPAKRQGEEFFKTLNQVQATRQKINDALMAKETIGLAEITATVEKQALQTGKLLANAKILKTALQYLETFSLGSLLALAADYTPELKRSEQRLFQQGKDIFLRINEQMSGAGQEVPRSLHSCVRKAEELDRLLLEKSRALEELQVKTSTLAGKVLQAEVFERIVEALAKIESHAASMRRRLDAWNQPIVEMEKRLREAFGQLSLPKYLAELDRERQKLAAIIISYANSNELVSAIDTMSEVLQEASVILAQVDELSAAIQQIFLGKKSRLNPDNIAVLLLKKYYFQNLWLMLKRFLGRALSADKIAAVIRLSPAIYRQGDGGDLAMSAVLDDFLKERLADYENSWVYDDVREIMAEGIARFVGQTKEFIRAYPIESYLTDKKQLGDLLDSIAFKLGALKT